MFSSLICFSSVKTAFSISSCGTSSLIADVSSSGIVNAVYECFSLPTSATILSINAIISLFTESALYIASTIFSSGISFAPASIIITLSLVDATVNLRSDTAICSSLGFTTKKPPTIPICVVAQGPSNGISEIAVAIADPSIAVSSGEQSGSTDNTRLLSVTSFL